MPEQRDRPSGADDALYERLAAIEHERWASWQRYLHSKCTVQIATDRDPGALVIPAGYVANLWRLIDTPYADLTEAEKASDREQVDRYWHLVGPVDESDPGAILSAWRTIARLVDHQGFLSPASIADRVALLVEAREPRDA